MAHGTTGTMDFGLVPYARRFAQAGLVVLAFDYRHFGASEGQPRQLISVRRQLADWRAAIRFARALPEVDRGRVALWGTSLSGGHVVAVAAADPAIRAVVAQLPFMGIETGRSSPRSGKVTAALFAAALRDTVGVVVGRRPVTVPIVGEPGAVAVFTGAEDAAVARELAAEAPTWRNEMAARSLFGLVGYRPGRLARRLRMPLLVCIAEGDTAASLPLAVRAAGQAPHGELRRYPGGHFAAYLGEVQQRMVTDQTGFLRRHLAVTPARATSPDQRHPDEKVLIQVTSTSTMSRARIAKWAGKR
jgi:alpha-beta hydrolase superfamily lysophospholipase